MAVIVSRVTSNRMQIRVIYALALATTYMSLGGLHCTHKTLVFIGRRPLMQMRRRLFSSNKRMTDSGSVRVLAFALFLLQTSSFLQLQGFRLSSNRNHRYARFGTAIAPRAHISTTGFFLLPISRFSLVASPPSFQLESSPM